MYILSDVVDIVRVGEYAIPEDAVKIVGGLMILHGIEMAKGRYVLTEMPNKKGMAKIIYDQKEMWQRALVYYNHNTYRTRQERRING